MTVTTARNDYLPLTPLQEGLLFETTLADDGDEAYVLHLVTELGPGVDPVRLRAAADAVLRRYPNLRACFRRRGSGEAVQVVVPEARMPWETVDLSGLPAHEASAAAEATLRARRAVGFDLASPPALRATLVTLPEDGHRFQLSMHHIVMDGWSVPLLVEALGAAYDGRATEEPELGFHDYLAWHGAQDAVRAEDAWARALDGVGSPTVVASPGARDTTGVRAHRQRLDDRATERLGGWARAQGLTLATVAQGAWALVLAHTTGRDDVVLGQVESGRSVPVAGIETTVGLLATTYPVRVGVDPARSLTSFLTTLQDDQNAMLPHRFLGLAAIQRRVGSQRLFDTILAFQNHPMPRDGAVAGGLDLRAADVVAATGYPVTVTVLPDADGLDVRLDERGEADGGALLDRFAGLLRALPDLDPELPLARVDVAAPAERAAVARWSAGPPAAVDVLPAALMARALARYGARTALVADGTTSSGADLHARANRLARALVARGVGPETVVAVCAPRSADVVVAMLAVLAAGGAFVYLDLGLPGARVADLLADVDPALVVGDSASLGTLADVAPGRSTLDVAAAQAGPGTSADPSTGLLTDPLTDADRTAPLRAEHPAYVIFTSGSTGRPKGVVVTHGGLANVLVDFVERVRLRPEDRLLALTTFTFDICHLEVLAPLVAGACVVLADPRTVRDVDAIARTVRREGVTVVQATPVHWREIVHERADVLDGLRAVTGGEPLTPALATALVGHGAEVHNVYGPTETTIWSTGGAVGPADVGDPTIGRPMRGTTVHVLDAALRPVGPGTVGELYIGGAGVALGYLGRAALTASRFVADPWGPPGGRLYRTGDLARWTRSGDLVCLGRTDHQVKVHGHRIELGEIESVLAQDPQVVQAVVVAVAPTADAERVLVAHVAAPDAGPDERATVEERLLTGLREVLPSYMVPGRVLVHPALPTTTSGKVDRHRLPLPERTATSDVPRTVEEERLVALFEDVLGREGVGVRDDFFALGGHSLLAVRLLARIRDELGAEIGLRTLFDHRDVASLAPVVRAAAPVGRPRLVPSPAARTEGPLSPGQRRMWVLAQHTATRGAYHVAMLARLVGELDTQALSAALADVVARHDVLRTVYSVDGAAPRQRVLPVAPDLVTLDVVDLRVQGRDVLDSRLARLSAEPFALDRDVPVRAACYRVDDDEHVLAVVVHHIATDGWSTAPFARDLAASYTARRRGVEPGLPDLEVQYLDVVDWHARVLGAADDPESVLSRDLAFWTTGLAGAPEVLPLPSDRPRPLVPTGRGHRIALEVDAAVHAGLRAVAEDRKATVFMVLHAALTAVLARSGAGTDVPVGTIVAGRDDPALDDLVGFFTNTLVLRLDASGDPTFESLVDRAREVSLAAHEHAQTPFDLVVDELAPSRDPGVNPLFQVMLVVQNTPPATLDLDGLRADAVVAEENVAKVDLVVELTERLGADGAPGGLHGGLEIAADLFDPERGRELAARLRRVLTAVARAPRTRVGALPVLSDAETASLARWSEGVPAAADADPWVGTTLAERFDAVVREHGPRTALVWGAPSAPRTLTYDELASLVRRTARELRARGVRPGDRVGVVVGRSQDALVVVLATLCAGAAYVPVDPAHPTERVVSTLDDAGPRVVVVRAVDAARLGDRELLVVDEPTTAERVARHDDAPLAEHERAGHGPGDPAYVIYTSGSTGRPKGVVVGQRSALALARSLRDLFGVEAGTRVLQFASTSFDASYWELAASLLSGGTAVLAPDDARAGAALASVLRDHTVDVTVLPPVVLSTMPTDVVLPPGLQLCVAGESCPVETVDRFAPVVRMRNLYGPTETTVHVTTSDLLAPGTVPIGRPMPGHVVRVLDENLAAVPVDVPGELYVGGDGLAHGYLDRPALTSERFVADPWGAPGARMYRTGDLVRRDDTGQLHHLGRLDRQVKIDGHRVEPGEVESALLACPGVAQAVVHVRALPAGRRELVAHVVPSPGRSLDGTALRLELRGRLPASAVPASVTPVERIPLTTNGKIDHAALPAPAPPAGASRPPADDHERRVCETFTQVLGRTVGPDEDFFDAGGNSIRAVLLATALRDAGTPVDVVQVLALRTPAAVARVTVPAGHEPGAAETVRDGAFAPVVRLRESGAGEPLFCVHSGLGLALPYADLAAALAPGRPVVGLQERAVVPGTDLPQSLHAAAVECADSIEAVQPVGDVRLLGWSYGGLVAHEVVAVLAARGRRVAHLAIVDAYPYDEATDGPLRAEDELLAIFLDHLGLWPADGPATATVEDAVALLARSGGPLAELSAEQVARFAELMGHHGRLARDHEPRRVPCAADVYVAAVPGRALDPTLLAERAARWADLVEGPVTTVPVGAEHERLMDPEPARAVAEHLSGRLDPPVAVEAPTRPAPPARGRPVGGEAPGRRSLVRDALSETAALVGRRLTHVRAAPGRLVGVVMNPLVILLAVGYLFQGAIVLPAGIDDYLDFLMAGVAIQVGLATIGPTAVSVRNDVDSGLVDRFRSLPVSRATVLVAHSVADLAIAFLGIVVVLVTGAVMGWRPETSLVGLAAGTAVALLLAYALVWLGIALGLTMRNAESIDAVASLVLVVLTFLSSAILAPEAFPAWVRPIVEWNPVSAAATICREAWGAAAPGTGSFPSEHPWLVLGVTVAVLLTTAVTTSVRRYASGR